jgi:hypothetical protein
MVFFDHKYMVKVFCVPFFPYIVNCTVAMRSLQMSTDRLEISKNITLTHAIAVQMQEIRQINQQFLNLLLHPDALAANSMFGLDYGVLDGLRRLSPEQQITIISVPGLLAEFSPLPHIADIDSIADLEQPFALTNKVWQRELQGFADRLLTCIWHAARHETPINAACMGLRPATCRKLAQWSFVALSRHSRDAVASLVASHARHPTFWPDLVACAHSNDPLRKVASQLSLLQLSVARQDAPEDSESCIAARPAYQ